MASKPPPQWNRPKFWRLCGRAADGQIVTLGRYETLEEANADRARFAADSGYRELEVKALETKPAPGV